MPLTKCPHCGRVHLIRPEMVGKVIGCLTPRCERNFHAEPYYRHRGPLSRFVFAMFIAFAAYLVIVFWGQTWVSHLRYIFARV